MGLRDTVGRILGRKSSIVYASSGPDLPDYIDMSHLREMLGGISPERLYRTQPHLRTVVTFRARNVAQLGLHTYKRLSETDRQRLRDHPVAKLIARPNPTMTTSELIYSLMADRDLYDYAIWHVTASADAPSGFEIWPIPPSWVTRQGGGTAWEPAWVEFARPNQPRPVRVSAADLVLFHGWNPGDPRTGSTPIDALKDVLAEQIQANAYRQQVWQNGGRVGAVLTRPMDATWSPEARERFSREWAAKWSGTDGAKAGGTPILEDGMTLQRIGFSAKEDEWVEGVKLSLSTVAQVYHVNPTMVGNLDNANFSNVREFRRMLYSDTLGPDISMIEDRLNAFLLPRFPDSDGVYVEFNIAEKLRGNFEEQASAMAASIGRPWMTADEGRALMNMSSLGGDAEHLVTPLNVLVDSGGETDPSLLEADDIKTRIDAAAALIRSGFEPAAAIQAVGLDPIKHLGLLPVTVQRPQEPDQVDEEAVDDIKSGGVQIKARAGAAYEKKVEQVLDRFFKRQQSVVLSALGSKDSSEWWSQDRWNKELSEDLFALALLVANEIGAKSAQSLGFNPGDYDVARTEAFLKSVAESRADMINATTRDRIEKALASDSPDDTPTHVFEEARSARVGAAAKALITTFSAFATTEAGQQLAPGKAVKTWVVTSKNPRATHSAMNGQTVPVGEKFSNGADWPGDPALGADEVSGCECTCTVTVPGEG